MFDEDSKCKFALYLGFFLTIFGYSGRFIGIEPVNSQFFAFAVWSLILLTDNLAYRFKGNSPLRKFLKTTANRNSSPIGGSKRNFDPEGLCHQSKL